MGETPTKKVDDKPLLDDRFRALVGERGAIAVAWQKPEPQFEVAEKEIPDVQVPHQLEIKGNLILIGGGIRGEYIAETMQQKNIPMEKVEGSSYDPTGIYRKMAGDFGIKGASVTVITGASNENEKSEPNLERIFTLLGARKIHIIGAIDRDKIDTQENIDALKSSSFVFIDGGKQENLSRRFEGTQALGLMQERLKNEKGFTLAGTSAGAMIASDAMMNGGRMEKGFGWVPIVVDTHFSQRKRLPRLQKLVMDEAGPDAVGIGLDEGTAVKINGTTVETYAMGETLSERSQGKMSEKNVVVIRKQNSTDGKPVLNTRDIACTGGECIIRFASMPTPLVVVPVIDPMSVTVPTALPAPPAKEPMMR